MSTEGPEWTDHDEYLAQLDTMIEALDSICETYSEAFGGIPGGPGRLEVVERAWSAASEAMQALLILRGREEGPPAPSD